MVTEGYATPDWEVVDYQMYCLDPEVIDRQTNTGLLLRGPKPQHLEKGKYFVCIGAAQTFGRFCEKPYPTLLQERLNVVTLNLGYGGAGPSFFSKDNDRLLKYINNARFAIIQVMSGRSESNSLFESRGLGFYTRISDGTSIGCDDAFRELLKENDRDYIKKIVAETRHNWVNNYKELLEKITIPKILFWFSVRKPHYREKYDDVSSLFGEFPQLVNFHLINQIKKYCNEYVECITRQGLPHLLVNRFTGEPITVEDPWGGSWSKNWYYPSPGMHREAATALEKVCKKYLNPIEFHQQSKPSFVSDKWLFKKTIIDGKYTYLRNLCCFHLKNVALDLGILGGHTDYCRFIILGRARSGSNFLRGLLNSHQQIITFGELFRAYDSIGWEFPDYDQYLQSRSLRSFMQNDPGKFLEERVFKKFPKRILAVGFKLFYYHAQDDSRKIIWPYLKDQKDIKIIHLQRNNTLRVLLSLKKAFQTDKWTNITGEEETSSILLDCEECLREFTWSQEVKKQYGDYFEGHHKIDVSYENLSNYCEDEIKRIQAFLGVQYEIVKPSTFKQSNQPLSKSISNYFELKEKFKGTSWEKFFEE